VPTRVVLIEDNDVFRQALELLLAIGRDIEIAASEPDGTRAVELCLELRPDVLIVDYRLPGLDGVELTRVVRERCPEVAVVALTAAAGEREREALLEAGAVRCIRKDEPLEVIVDAVRTAAGIGAALAEGE
jgi:DNA-binding NarL/FixJ family response regulator